MFFVCWLRQIELSLLAKHEVFVFIFSSLLFFSVCIFPRRNRKTRADDLTHVEPSPLYSTEHPAGNSREKHCCADLLKPLTDTQSRTEQSEIKTESCCTENKEADREKLKELLYLRLLARHPDTMLKKEKCVTEQGQRVCSSKIWLLIIKSHTAFIRLDI